MSKAEEKAKEYCKSTLVGSPYVKKMAYIEGYHQAEKDLELTWEDIPEIFSISERLKTSWWFRDNEQTKLIGK